MNDGEIITSYKQAADKSKQVGVLAELNAVSRSEMEIHLERLGLLKRRVGTPVAKPLPDAAGVSGSITVSCLLKTLTEMAEKFPDALVFFGDRQTPSIVRMSVLSVPGCPTEAEIYLMEGEPSAEQKGRKV